MKSNPNAQPNPKIHSSFLPCLNLLSITTSGTATIFGEGHSASLHHRRVVHLSASQHRGIMLNSITSIPKTQPRTTTVTLYHRRSASYQCRVVPLVLNLIPLSCCALHIAPIPNDSSLFSISSIHSLPHRHRIHRLNSEERQLSSMIW